MMRRYEEALRKNMASAERDMKDKPEDRRGFVIGAVFGIWSHYRNKQINEAQFDQLIAQLAAFSSGEYKDFIAQQVMDYKSGNPPTIVGY